MRWTWGGEPFNNKRISDPICHIRIIVPFIKRPESAVPKSRNAIGFASRTKGDDATSAPRLRADARRNEEAVLDAAKVVFARSGVDAPIREIATQAGVGLGTLYRRFPTRADL